MPVRRRVSAVATNEPNPLSVFRWSDTGLDPVLGEPCYRTPAEALRVWQKYRRPVWAQTHRFSMPGPAAIYDGLTLNGLDFVRSHWNHTGPFDLAGALAALDADRAALAAFKQTRGARAIADYLAVLRADLDTIDATAHELAAWPADEWRPYPMHLNTGQRYGDPRGETAR